MIGTPPLRPFLPTPPGNDAIVSWVQIGDLHMTVTGGQNHHDLLQIVNELNSAFVDGLAFVFIPGDIADHGSAAQYEVVRRALDPLQIPWCAIVGDHDVHEKSFTNFVSYMAAQTRYAFSVGKVRFFALNAFDVPDPGSFTLLSDQLVWLEQGLEDLRPGETAVLFLHCYPTDLKQGGGELRQLIRRYPVRLISMGHTHYNEVANDGHVLYTATRSTGQIEEGPAGYSITNIDGSVVSWKFIPLGALPVIMITSPPDERFITQENTESLNVDGDLCIRIKSWSTAPAKSMTAHLAGVEIHMSQVADSNVWQGSARKEILEDGVHALSADMIDEAGTRATDEIRIVVGAASFKAPERAERDQDNALAAWPERGLVGTQLGPNKFGRKW